MSKKFYSKDNKITDDYFNYQIDAVNKYGKNSIVLMEVGHFYEIYGLDNETEKIGLC